MGQHRRFPASFFIVLALLAIPSLLYGFVRAAERADECAAVTKAAGTNSQTAKAKFKCE